MKSADRENPNRWATTPSNRDFGAEGQNRSLSIEWAAKQEKLRPAEMCFFLTPLYRTYQTSAAIAIKLIGLIPYLVSVPNRILGRLVWKDEARQGLKRIRR